MYKKTTVSEAEAETMQDGREKGGREVVCKGSQDPTLSHSNIKASGIKNKIFFITDDMISGIHSKGIRAEKSVNNHHF